MQVKLASKTRRRRVKNNAWNRMMDLVFVSLALAATATGQDLTATEREKAIRFLTETRNALTTAVCGLSEAQWRFTAGPDRWSIAEVLEHITVTEEFFLANVRFQILRAPEVASGSNAAAVDAQLTSLVGDRSVKFEAPPMLRPDARWIPSATLEHFLRARLQTAEFLE